jgi:hypothetical protein
MKSPADLIQKMPVKFVPQEHVEGQCSIAELKKMRGRRGEKGDELNTIQDRTNLDEYPLRLRRCSEIYCICFERYEAGELLRILTRCHHLSHGMYR